MREIKFRAWHTVQKKMYPAEELGADQLTLSVDGRGFVNVHGGRNELSTFAGDKLIPMQFTGLRDKNGKEIYEGDLVRRENLTIERVDQIVYAADRYCAFMRKWPDGTLDWIDRTVIEIVGNIHENPELLR